MRDYSIPLNKAGNGDYKRRKGKAFEFLWMVIQVIFVTNSLQISSRLRVTILRLFGARIGNNVTVRPGLKIKLPWQIKIGDDSWIGDSVWMDNHGEIEIGSNSIISQGCYLTTGSHDAKKNMDLIVKNIKIGDGVWITARCVVLGGVNIGNNSIITVNSVVHKNIEPNVLYGGNPAKFIKDREIEQ